jgi:hypothetical protein
MKLYIFFLSVLLAACAPRNLTLVPPVSPPLQQEEVFAWSGQAAGNRLFACAAGIGWVDTSGQIVTWDPEKKAAGRGIRLPFAVSEDLFCQNGFLALPGQAKDRLLIFDLARMETRFVASDLTLRRILAVDGRHVVYLDGESLVVRDWQKQDGDFRQPARDLEFFNCHFLPERILILSRSHLFVFWKQDGRFQQFPLPVPAAGAFVHLGGNIFYGSSQRELANYSLRLNKLDWKMKLGHDLERQPLAQSGTVVVSPADNSILQLNRRGSVRWWLALDSILLYNLVPLADHLAAFLLNNEIKFIHCRGQEVIVFKISGRPTAMPLAYKNDLYFFMADGKELRLQRVGNRYGVDVKISPAQVQLPDAPVTFSFQTSNLIRPRIQCVIRDEAGRALLEKKFTPADRGRLVWLPRQAGMYRLQMSAAALNRTVEKELSFLVFDPRRIILYFQLYL